MTHIETWVQSPLAIATAKTLLHSIWQATLAGFALAACLAFIRPARIRYAAACAALLAVVAASAGTFLVMAQGSAARHLSYPGMQWRSVVLPAPADTASIGPNPSALQRVLRWITPVWLLGLLLINIRQIGSWAAARRMRSRGVCVAPDMWQQRLVELQQRMKVSKPILLLESCLTQVPLVIGHLVPAILVPIGLLSGLPAEQVELLLMHELAHIARYDYAINLLQTFIESLMFYNPAVWWISRVIRTEREHCCDDVAVQPAEVASIYAAALTAIEESRSRHAKLAMAATGGSLMKRVRRILRQPEPPSSIAVPVMGTALIVLIAGGLLVARPAPRPQPERTVGTAALTPTATQPQPQPTSVAVAKSPARTQAPLAPAYQRWLDEDVVYIIFAEERVAFLGLTTDEERNQFIEQFWLRRDPTPGTAENEYKDEHYRRIQYANEHFSSSLPLPTGAGWRTDRGRFYISYGKPDELESHPSGGSYQRPADQGGGTTNTYPFEIWLYRYIQGVGTNVVLEFVDSRGTGEFPRAATANSLSPGARGRGSTR